MFSEHSKGEYSRVFDELVADLPRDVSALKLPSDGPIRSDEFCISEEPLSYDDVYLTKILSPGDPDCDSRYFRASKFAEVQGLKERETWDVVEKRDMPTGANVLGGRFVLDIKNFGSKDEKARARFVVQGHRDKEKDFLVHNTTSLRQRSVRIIVTFAAVKGYRVFRNDIKQAYLQSDEELSRQIFVVPKRKDLQFFEMGENDALDLRKPLYGNGDSREYWGVTFDRHARHDLNMTPTDGDPSLFIIKKR